MSIRLTTSSETVNKKIHEEIDELAVSIRGSLDSGTAQETFDRLMELSREELRTIVFYFFREGLISSYKGAGGSENKMDEMLQDIDRNKDAITDILVNHDMSDEEKNIAISKITDKITLK